jgi:hypothetical protein
VAYISTKGTFEINLYDSQVNFGFAKQGLKQSFQTLKEAKGSKSGIALKLSPDYGFFENSDFVTHL